MAAYSGVENSGKVLVLENGMTAEPLGMSNEDAQFLQTRDFTICEIAAFLNIPPFMIGSKEVNSSYSSLEQQTQQYLSFTLDPWLVVWEQEIYRKLLTPTQQQADSHYAEFMRQRIVTMDHASKVDSYASGIQNGC